MHHIESDQQLLLLLDLVGEGGPLLVVPQDHGHSFLLLVLELDYLSEHVETNDPQLRLDVRVEVRDFNQRRQ